MAPLTPAAPEEGPSQHLAENVDEAERGSLVKALSLILVTALILYTLYERAAVLQQIERTARDFQAQLRSPAETSPVAVVTITDEDYRTLFGSTSPLNPSQLERLLAAIAEGNPRLIAVDLATDDPRFLSLATEIDVPIVWARELVECEARTPAPPACRTDDRWVLLDYAGTGSSQSLFGLVLLRTDSDGVIRRYTRFVDIGDTVPSFATAIAEAARGRVGPPTDEEYLINYRPLPAANFYSASFILEASKGNGFGREGVLEDRIVLVGGAYRAARDRYRTPIGEKHGVEVLAQIVQTELDVETDADREKPVGANTIGVLLFLNGLFLLLLFQAVTFPKAFWLSLVLIPAVATLCSVLFANSWFALWPYLLPLLVAVLVQQLYAHAVRYRNTLIRQYAKRLPGGIRGEGWDGE